MLATGMIERQRGMYGRVPEVGGIRRWPRVEADHDLKKR
jgi:hypothetical protein